MIFRKPFRKLFKYIYIKSDILVSKFIPQGNDKQAQKLYRFWSQIYDFSIKLDRNYLKGLYEMVDSVVSVGDKVFDIGCGTGFASIYAAKTAESVVGIDLSPDMIRKCRLKLKKQGITNVSTIIGSFPRKTQNLKQLDSIISSHTFIHFTPQQRKNNYKVIFGLLRSGGKLGLFTSKGEMAPMFEKRDELKTYLKEIGFQKIKVESFPDMYWIVTAQKP